ncbi:MAG: amidohydrolase family protein [Nocardioides sp.]
MAVAALALAASLGLAGTAARVSAQAAAPARTAIHAGWLLADPDAGTVLTERTVVIEGGRVLSIEPGYMTPEGASVIDLRDAFVLPGLIDGHVHVTKQAGPTSELDKVSKTASALTLDGLVHARRLLAAGFTTVADLGVVDNAPDNEQAVFALRDAIAAGMVEGPRILAAGSIVTPHGGHGETHGFRPDVVRTLANPSACSGVDDCRRVVREQVRRGADIIKVTATGGVLSGTDAGLEQQFTDSELAAIVETAHALGRGVTAHAHGRGGVEAALRAGVDSIQHGTFLSRESIPLFRKTGAALAPTLLAEVTVGCNARDPHWRNATVRAKALAVAPAAIAAARLAHATGVSFIFGTDAGVFPHGNNAYEFVLLHEAGLSPLQALRSATTNAARSLRLERTVGRIAPDMTADIVAVRGNPLDDLRVLSKMLFVMQSGRIIDVGAIPPARPPC